MKVWGKEVKSKKLRIGGNEIISSSCKELYKGFYKYEIDKILDNLEIIKIIEGMRNREGKLPSKSRSTIDGYEIIIRFKNENK